MIYVLFALILYFLFITTQIGLESAIIIVIFVTIFIVASFVALTVVIDDKYLRIKFGYGIFFKKFLLTEIISVEIVKNHWYCGWGVRFCLRPRMWIFNVSGFDAVEIVMSGEKKYRIGTDEPQSLADAITQVIRK